MNQVCRPCMYMAPPISNSGFFENLKQTNDTLKTELEQMKVQALDPNNLGCGTKCREHMAIIDSLVPTTDTVMPKGKTKAAITRNWGKYRNDKMNAFCMQLYEHEKLQVIDGRMVGTRTKKNKVVSIHELMSDTYIPFELSQLQCIYVPYKEILSMPKYSWFAYLSVQDVQNSDTMIGKWLVKNEYAFEYDGGTKKSWKTFLENK